MKMIFIHLMNNIHQKKIKMFIQNLKNLFLKNKLI